MASNLRKAGSAIRKSFRSRRYAMFDTKENDYIVDSPSRFRTRTHSDSEAAEDNCGRGVNVEEDAANTTAPAVGLRRGTSMTQSMRQAVGTIKQKLRMSTRRHSRLGENQSPSRGGRRRHSLGGVRKSKNIKMSSPFKIDTPSRASTRNGIKTCLSMETPTRLRREVEALTSNLQALSTLTPNTLHARRSTRQSSPLTLTNGSLRTQKTPRLTPPLTNGSLKTPRSSRRRITTDIY
ncbi:uncharacterized protein LOC101861700 [Aplysia californica]|uniref:Uncharacterized protein LOC101861700 n=1 Tax=Aplysia californica TaxID=6500 RepID=A0ABM0K9A0_APLCA|nr:uncharacterized protein LOC101861700 [Aplysia californica]